MRKTGWVVMTVFATIIGAYAIAVLAVPAMRAPFLQQRFLTMPLAAMAHLAAAAVALVVGPLQHNSRLRGRFLNLHRWTGRTYVLAVLFGGAAALRLATVSQGGPPAHFGFGVLAVLWLLTTGQAYRSIRAGDQDAHRRWMTRSYALTFAAVTLRIYLPLSQVVGIPFEPAYQAISWLCWLPNLMVAEWLILRRPMTSPIPAPDPIAAT